MVLDSMKQIFECSERENLPFWEIVLRYDMDLRQVSRQASMAKMLSTWQAIQDAADSYTGTQRSVSGLVGGDGLKMRLYLRRGDSIGGDLIGEAIALKNLMGLVCDPVAGLVEVPCVKRNVIGAVNAISAADMALAGIESRIPVDEVIDAMGEVGRRMPVEFRETALGGLAATPTGEAVKARMPHGEPNK